jgi:hypothetical protein
MAHASRVTTALVATALGLATVTASLMTLSAATSVADPATAKIQDRMEHNRAIQDRLTIQDRSEVRDKLKSEVRLIAIDDPIDVVLMTDTAAGVTTATRAVPMPAPRSAELPTGVPAGVPLPQPRPQAEVVVGSLDPATALH